MTDQTDSGSSLPKVSPSPPMRNIGCSPTLNLWPAVATHASPRHYSKNPQRRETR